MKMMKTATVDGLFLFVIIMLHTNYTGKSCHGFEKPQQLKPTISSAGNERNISHRKILELSSLKETIFNSSRPPKTLAIEKRLLSGKDTRILYDYTPSTST
jgi:hypothetical protein